MGNAFKITGINKVITNLGKINSQVTREVKKTIKKYTKEITTHAKSNHPEWNTMVYNPDGQWRYHNITYTLTKSITDQGIIKEGIYDGEIIGQSTAGNSEAFYAEKQEYWHPYMSVALIANKFLFRDDIKQNISLGTR